MKEYRLITDIGEYNWEQGLKWIRKTKSLLLHQIVIDIGLSDNHIEKLKELNVQVVKPKSHFFSFIREVCEDDFVYCNVNFDKDIKFDICCYETKLDISKLLLGVSNIPQRVILSNKFEKTYGFDFLNVTYDTWNFLDGFASFSLDSGFVEMREGFNCLIFNLFVLYFKDVLSVEIEKMKA